MRPGRYVFVLLATALVCAPLLYFGAWAGKVAGCRRLDRPGAFLAACEVDAYGSYEHEAYYYGLEPRAVDAFEHAQVLFLGNSRLQMAFSTPQVDRFFADRAVPYHLLGFGYGESSRFPARLLDRYRPRPKVVVINADPFFTDVFSPPAYDIARAPRASWADGWMKRVFGRVRPLLCRWPGLCAEDLGATYRDTATGQWIWHDVLVPRGTIAQAITTEKANPWPQDRLDAWVRAADPFLAALGVPRACVILTAVPTPAIDAEAMAAVLARALGTPLVLADVDGLSALDNSHLGADSAERWSADFMQRAAPTIDACLGRP